MVHTLPVVGSKGVVGTPHLCIVGHSSLVPFQYFDHHSLPQTPSLTDSCRIERLTLYTARGTMLSTSKKTYKFNCTFQINCQLNYGERF
jgi:hypothetical protein